MKEDQVKEGFEKNRLLNPPTSILGDVFYRKRLVTLEKVFSLFQHQVRTKYFVDDVSNGREKKLQQLSVANDETNRL